MEWTRQSLSRLALVLVLLVVVACKPVAPGTGTGSSRVHVAQVRVDAAGVRLNGQPISNIVPLFVGDDVQTDNGRATIFFDVGGLLVLGPGTDPELQLVSEAGCLGMAILQVLIRSGTFNFLNVTQVCFCDLQNVVCGVPESDFRVVITSSGASIKVSRGALRVTVGRPPQQHRLVQGQEMVVQRGRVVPPSIIQ